MSARCAREGCGAPVTRRPDAKYCSAYCQSREGSRRRKRRLREIHGRTCKRCGEAMDPSKSARALFCRAACKVAFHNDRARKETTRACKRCGVEFAPPHYKSAFCGDDCRSEYARESAVERARVAAAKPRRSPALIVVETPREEGAPRTRGDCATGERPCPWLGCRYHLFADVGPMSIATPGGRVLAHNAPDEEAELWVDDLVERLRDATDTCALDVADRGGVVLEEVGSICGVTRERIRQIEARALVNMAKQVKRKLGPSGARDLREGK